MRETITIISSKVFNFFTIIILYKTYLHHLDGIYIIAQILFSIFVSYYASITHLTNKINKIALLLCLAYILALMLNKTFGTLDVGAQFILTLPLFGFLNYANTIHSKISVLIYYSAARLILVIASIYIAEWISSTLLWLFIISYLYNFAKTSECKLSKSDEIKINFGMNISIAATIAIVNMIEAYIKYAGIKGQMIVLFEVLDVYLPLFGVIYTLQYQILQRRFVHDNLTLSVKKARLVYIIVLGGICSIFFILVLQAAFNWMPSWFKIPNFYYLLIAALVAFSNAIRSYFVNGAMLMVKGIGNDTSLKMMVMLGFVFILLNFCGISPLHSYVISGLFSSLLFGAITWLKLR